MGWITSIYKKGRKYVCSKKYIVVPDILSRLYRKELKKSLIKNEHGAYDIEEQVRFRTYALTMPFRLLKLSKKKRQQLTTTESIFSL